MNQTHQGSFVEHEGVHLHYIEYPSDGPPMLLLHSLSANAYIFQGLIANGLSKHFRLIIPDLRGRGFSDHPNEGYTLEQESKDLIALLDHLNIDRVTLAGHSFGGLLAIYFAAHYPDRVQRLVILDAAVTLNPLTAFLISYSTARLLMNYPSWDSYLEHVRKAPFMDKWDASILPFLKADVREESDGRIFPRSSWIDITKAAYHIFSISEWQWKKYVGSIEVPTVLLYARDAYTHGQHIVLRADVVKTIALLKDGTDKEIEGNHVTMLFGKGAGEIVSTMARFGRVAKKAPSPAMSL